jgi:hypothetical protein
MKTSKRYLVKSEKIHSLNDLQMEKMRLRMEILKTEERIHAGYRDILDALSFKNIASTVMNDVTASSTILARAFSFGKALMAKRKKKKHDSSSDLNSTDPS